VAVCATAFENKSMVSMVLQARFVCYGPGLSSVRDSHHLWQGVWQSERHHRRTSLALSYLRSASCQTLPQHVGADQFRPSSMDFHGRSLFRSFCPSSSSCSLVSTLASRRRRWLERRLPASVSNECHCPGLAVPRRPAWTCAETSSSPTSGVVKKL
jgi:hypothetical protein